MPSGAARRPRRPHCALSPDPRIYGRDCDGRRTRKRSKLVYTVKEPMHGQAGPLFLLAAAGFFQAAFALPVKHLRKWRWEQMWVTQGVRAPTGLRRTAGD